MTLPKTTRGRLNLYRQRAEKSKYGKDWRGHRYARTWGTGWHSGVREDGLILTDNKETLGDYLGDWADFAHGARYLRDCSGFYTDGFCAKTMRGGRSATQNRPLYPIPALHLPF